MPLPPLRASFANGWNVINIKAQIYKQSSFNATYLEDSCRQSQSSVFITIIRFPFFLYSSQFHSFIPFSWPFWTSNDNCSFSVVLHNPCYVSLVRCTVQLVPFLFCVSILVSLWSSAFIQDSDISLISPNTGPLLENFKYYKMYQSIEMTQHAEALHLHPFT